MFFVFMDRILTDCHAACNAVSCRTLSKTPDAPRIQPLLRPYERIARLRAVFSDADFRAWLGRPNRHVDGHTSMDLLEDRRAEVVADLVEDMLLGAPG